MRRKRLVAVAAFTLGGGLAFGVVPASASAVPAPIADCVAWTVTTPGMVPPAFPVKLGWYFGWYAQQQPGNCDANGWPALPPPVRPSVSNRRFVPPTDTAWARTAG